MRLFPLGFYYSSSSLKAVSGRKFLAVGCPTGVFVSVAGHESGKFSSFFCLRSCELIALKAFKKALIYSNPKYMAALQTIENKVLNRFIVHSESIVMSYSLELLARLALDQTTRDRLDASMERIGSGELNIVFCRCAQINGRGMGKHSNHIFSSRLNSFRFHPVIYAIKRRLSTTLTLCVTEAVGSAETDIISGGKHDTRAPSFRPVGEVRVKILVFLYSDFFFFGSRASFRVTHLILLP